MRGVRHILSMACFVVLFGCVVGSSPADATAAGGGYRGTLELFHADTFGQAEPTHPDSWYLNTGTQRLRLDFEGDDPLPFLEAGPGADVLVRARRDGEALDVAGAEAVSSQKTTTSEADRRVSGKKRLAVVMVNFADRPIESYSVPQMRNMMFTGSESVANWVDETSGGRVTLAGRDDARGDVFGWYTLPTASWNGCGYTDWAATLRTMAAPDGYAAEDYDYTMYMVMPSKQRGICPGSGWAYVGGAYSWVLAWPDGFRDTRETALHELGHNFGLNHSQADTCRDPETNVAVPEGGTCHREEYGDPYDPMGDGAQLHTSAYQKARIGWIPERRRRLADRRGGTYELTSASQMRGVDPDALQLLEVRIPNGIGGYLDESYFVEYRTRRGFDALRPFGWDGLGDSLPRESVLVRRAEREGYAPMPVLVSGQPWTRDANASSLVFGERLHDAESGLTLSLVGRTASSASVQVVYGHDTTPPSAPSAPAMFRESDASQAIVRIATDSWDWTGIQLYEVRVNGVPVDYRSRDDFGTFGRYVVIPTPAGTATRVSVVARDWAGNRSAPSRSLRVNTRPTEPGQPTLVSDERDQVRIRWEPAQDDTGGVFYEVWRNGAPYRLAAGNQFTDRAVDPDRSYAYSVVAIDPDGTRSNRSRATFVDRTPPEVPTGLRAVATTRNSVELRWNASNDNIGTTKYYVFRGNGSFVGWTQSTRLGFTEGGLGRGTTYRYVVAAVDAAGNVSARSAETRATTRP